MLPNKIRQCHISLSYEPTPLSLHFSHLKVFTLFLSLSLSLTAMLIKPCELKKIIYPPLSAVSGNRINFPSKTDT